jgi:hypothetical protein
MGSDANSSSYRQVVCVQKTPDFKKATIIKTNVVRGNPSRKAGSRNDGNLNPKMRNRLQNQDYEFHSISSGSGWDIHPGNWANRSFS